MKNIQSLEGYVVIDLDTGTVLGKNCVLVKASKMETAIRMETATKEVAKNFGLPLFADVPKFY